MCFYFCYTHAQDRSALSEITRAHATPTDNGSNLDVDSSDDWLHSNPTYIRRAMLAKHVEDSSVPISFISGRSIEPLGIAYNILYIMMSF